LKCLAWGKVIQAKAILLVLKWVRELVSRQTERPMTTDIITARASTSGVRFDALAAALKRPLQVWHQWREQRRATANLATMSDAELKDLGLERDSRQVAIARGRPFVESIFPF
jgi:uncharacterized protein YjiS (DUF1127 family)